MLNAFIPCVPQMHPLLTKQTSKGIAYTTCGDMPFVFFLETGAPSPQESG